MKKKTLSVNFRLKNRPWGWHKWNHVPKHLFYYLPDSECQKWKNLRGNLGNLSCSRKQFGSHRMAFLNVKKTYSYQVKKNKKKINPSAFDKKSKSPFFKIMTTQFCVWAIIVLLCNLVTQASTTGLNRKMFWSHWYFLKLKYWTWMRFQRLKYC